MVQIDMKIKNICKMGGAAMLLCGALFSCKSTSITESAAPAVLSTAAPLSMDGKIIVLDHSRAYVSQLGVGAAPVNVLTHSWTEHSGCPVAELSYGQWSGLISFIPGTPPNGAKVTYSYKKISETEAMIEGREEYNEEEWSAVEMKLKFVSPTEAEVMYHHYGVDDLTHFFTNVKACIK